MCRHAGCLADVRAVWPLAVSRPVRVARQAIAIACARPDIDFVATSDARAPTNGACVNGPANAYADPATHAHAHRATDARAFAEVDAPTDAQSEAIADAPEPARHAWATHRP